MGIIINLVQNFVGSNNLNFLMLVGQFGIRFYGGKDVVSFRYIFIMMSFLIKLLFYVYDMFSFIYLFDDNQFVEFEWYCFIIFLVLVNGVEGIGIGYSIKVFNFDVR